MDAVILAAGRNERLANYVPAFHKPLLPLVGTITSLLHNAVQLAMLHAERPVVVASPVNAYDISRDLAGLPVDIVIQRVPTGPGDALRLGLALKVGEPSSDRVLVLLSDNTLTQDDVSAVCLDHKTAIGCRSMHHDEAERFTWYDADEYRWREKERVPDRLPQVHCWVGPFVGYRKEMEHVLRHAPPVNGEYLIGPYLDELTNRGTRVQVSSRDVGTEESYLTYMKGE